VRKFNITFAFVILSLVLPAQAAELDEFSLLAQLQPIKVMTVVTDGNKITWAKGKGRIKNWCFRLDVLAMASATKPMQEISLATYVYNEFFNTANQTAERIPWCDD